MNFTIHDDAGRIIRTGYCPDGMETIQAKAGERMLPDRADLHAHYVAAGVVTDRPANPATLIGTTLLNLPNPCTVTINGRDYQCDDVTADLGFTHVGSYAVKVSAFPFLDAHFTVTK
jgi:hypothetical protein